MGDVNRLRAGFAVLRALPCFDPEEKVQLDVILGKAEDYLLQRQPAGSSSSPAMSSPPLPPPPQLPARGLMAAPPVPGPHRAGSCFLLTHLHDGGWSAMLPYLDLEDIVQCRNISKEVSGKVTDCLTQLPLSDMAGVKWLTADVLAALTSFPNIKTLQWFVSSGETVEADEAEAAGGDAHTHHPWLTKHVALWAFLLGRMPRIEEVILLEGPDGSTDERALEELYDHILPLCAPRLRSITFGYERYSGAALDEDRPPINIKKFAVMLASRKPFPLLKELSFQMPSMSIMQQRSLVRALGRSGLLNRLEKLAIGGGTTSYARPKVGPGRDLAEALRRHRCPLLKTLHLQRTDMWDDVPGLARALGPAFCPALTELHIDLTVDCDDAYVLARHLHEFPPSLRCLGLEVMGIKGRTADGHFEVVGIEPSVEAISRSLAFHPRPTLETLELSLHYEDLATEQQRRGRGKAPKEDALPLLNALIKGACPNLRCLQMPDCQLGPEGFAKLRQTLKHLPKLQTMDLSGNFFTPAEAELLAPALKKAPFVYELTAHDVVDTEEEEKALEKAFEGSGLRLYLRDEEGGAGASEDGDGADDAGEEEEFFDDDEDMAEAGEGEEGEGEENEAEEGANNDGWESQGDSDGEVPAELGSDDEMDG